MNQIYIFGSCAGTEPIKEYHHTALALEINSKIYWFDAGEECAYTVCDYVNSKEIKRCVFVHNGREILNDFNGSQAFLEKNMNCPVEISRDKTIIKI